MEKSARTLLNISSKNQQSHYLYVKWMLLLKKSAFNSEWFKELKGTSS